ncbi:pentatricopeptide repeat-containing protein [Canna indica]|uniref:Pentatricopeptide repeat-containing protein n=1 Tax=Canna indica TaxID=4628 RepID=A0AAQ3KKV5_9LILI|nr:pentatricopeptide repeat-containing protein [Canna indica]
MSHKTLIPSLLREANSAFPDVSASLIPVLTAASPSLLALRAAHALLIVSGAASHKPLARHLIALYTRRFSTADAILVYSRLRSPDPIASHLILKTLVRSRCDPSVTVAFFCRQVNPVGCRPNLCTFPILIAASKMMESIHQGEIFHCLALKLGFLSFLPIPNSLIHMYACCDGLDLARQLFDEMPVKDRVSYDSLIDGYVKCCNFNEAEELFRDIPHRNEISWSNLLNGYVRNKMFHKAVNFFHQMQELSIEPNDTSLVSLLSVYSHFKLAKHGKSIHGFFVRRWLRVPTHASTALVDFYCACELFDEAVKVFNRIKNKDLICWNTIISGFGSHGRSTEALHFFKRMLEKGMKPNDITFICVLVACAHSGLVEEALQYFNMMSSEFGIRPRFAHYWCLVDLYVRLESPQDALKVIQDMQFDDWSAIWGAVIWLARVRGDISLGEHLGKCLIQLEPENSRRYAPLLNVYAAASRWDKYKELQEMMKTRGSEKLPDCKLIDLNVVVHKFSVGDKSRPEIENVFQVLEEIAEQLKLQPPRVNDSMVDAI